MANLFELDATIDDKTMLLEQVMDAKWKWANTYSIGSASTVEDRMPVWYILDEFGSRIQHGDEDDSNVRLVPFFYLGGWACSLLFPMRDIDENEEILRDFLEGMYTVQVLIRCLSKRQNSFSLCVCENNKYLIIQKALKIRSRS